MSLHGSTASQQTTGSNGRRRNAGLSRVHFRLPMFWLSGLDSPYSCHPSSMYVAHVHFSCNAPPTPHTSSHKLFPNCGTSRIRPPKKSSCQTNLSTSDTVIMILCGLVLGGLSKLFENSWNNSVLDLQSWESIDPHLLLFVFLPPLIFSSAFVPLFFIQIIPPPPPELHPFLSCADSKRITTFSDGLLGRFFSSQGASSLTANNPKSSSLPHPVPLGPAF